MNYHEKTKEELYNYILDLQKTNQAKIESLNEEINTYKKSENSFSISETKLSKMIANLGDVIVIIDKEGINRYKSPNIEKWFEWKPGDVIGESTWDNVHPDDLELGQKFIGNIMSQPNAVGTEEVRYKCKDGSYKWIEFTASNLMDDPDIQGILGNYHDITDRKKSEEALKESELRFKQVSENANEWIWEVDKNGLYTYSSAIVKDILGYEINELVGKKYFYDLFDPLEKEQMKRDAFNAFYQKASFNGFLNQNIHKNGNRVYLSTSGVPIINKSGDLVGYRGVDIDITERVKAESDLLTANKRILESEKQFRLLFENMEQGFALHEMIYDQDENPIDYRFKLMNKAFEMLTGAKSTAFVGKTVKEVIPITEEHWIENYGKVAKTGIPLHFESFSQEFNRYYDVVAYSPEENYFATIFSDVTENKIYEKELIKAKEKAEESDRLKSAFLANVSHEIRTPMNGILGFAELLKEPKLTGAEQSEYIDIIAKSGERLLNIINDLINISKVESGQMNVIISETNINEQLEFLHDFFKPEAEQAGLQLLMECSLPFDQAIIHTDREKIYAILTNLIKNAIKFTNTGSIEFGYSLKEGSLEFFVKDTGIGISPHKQKAIFERFVQADMELSREYEGAGLGLSITKAYVEILGGSIWIESEEGKGSCFYFNLPATIDSKISGLKTIESVSEKYENDLSPTTILIAEDDESSVIYYRRILQNEHFNLIFVRTGEEAVEKCRNNPEIDIVLMDIKMYMMDGYSAAKIIKVFRPDLPIVAQTAFALVSDREKYIEAFDDYLAKPIKAEQLKNIINKHLKHK